MDGRGLVDEDKLSRSYRRFAVVVEMLKLLLKYNKVIFLYMTPEDLKRLIELSDQLGLINDEGRDRTLPKDKEVRP